MKYTTQVLHDKCSPTNSQSSLEACLPVPFQSQSLLWERCNSRSFDDRRTTLHNFHQRNCLQSFLMVSKGCRFEERCRKSFFLWSINNSLTLLAIESHRETFSFTNDSLQLRTETSCYDLPGLTKGIDKILHPRSALLSSTHAHTSSTIGIRIRIIVLRGKD